MGVHMVKIVTPTDMLLVDKNLWHCAAPTGSFQHFHHFFLVTVYQVFDKTDLYLFKKLFGPYTEWAYPGGIYFDFCRHYLLPVQKLKVAIFYNINMLRSQLREIMRLSTCNFKPWLLL